MQDIINLAVGRYSGDRVTDLLTKAPDQATLDALPNSLDQLARITSSEHRTGKLRQCRIWSMPITAFVPRGWLLLHGLQAGLTRRFSNGLTFQSAYTWSHTIDNSTADFHTSDITPRRPQDFFNFDSGKGELGSRPCPTVHLGDCLRLAVLQGR